MCLIVKKNAHFKYAKRNIVVYKVIEKGHNYLRTPYQHMPIAIGETYKESNLHVILGEVTTGLHSFCRLWSTKKLCKKMTKSSQERIKYIITKCIIPKGSKYIKGRVNGEYFEKGYVSDTLTYVKVI